MIRHERQEYGRGWPIGIRGFVGFGYHGGISDLKRERIDPNIEPGLAAIRYYRIVDSAVF